jgi:hypothetical protein
LSRCGELADATRIAMDITDTEARWAEVIGRGFAPQGVVLDGIVDEASIGEGVRDEARSSPWYFAIGLRAAILLVWLSPIWRLGRLKTFGGLSSEEQVELLETLLKSRLYPVRLALMLLKLTVCMILVGEERALRRVGAYHLKEEGDTVVPLRKVTP